MVSKMEFIEINFFRGVWEFVVIQLKGSVFFYRNYEKETSNASTVQSHSQTNE